MVLDFHLHDTIYFNMFAKYSFFMKPLLCFSKNSFTERKMCCILKKDFELEIIELEQVGHIFKNQYQI